MKSVSGRRRKISARRLAALVGVCAAVLGVRAAVAWPSDMLTINAGGQGRAALAQAWGLNPADAGNLFSSNGALRVVQVGGSIPANILWPGDTEQVTLQFQNLTDRPIEKTGRLVTIQYELFTPTSPNTDVFDVHIRQIADAGSVPISIDVPAHGIQNVTVVPFVPARFGGYAVVVDFPGMDRLFGAGCVRSIKPDEAPSRFPRLAMDCPAVELSERLGVAPNRIGVPYKPTTDPDYASYMADLEKTLDTYKAAHIPLTLEFGINNGLQPGDCYGRSHLDDKGVMTGDSKDFAWLPAQDPDFQRFVEQIAVGYGWPKGPVSAMKFMNEPWNGGGISGWNADDERYREIFRALCCGVAAAKREAGVDIYTGGTDSSSDTGDKLFGDGKTTFLPNLDFMSIHYQGLNPATTIRMFNGRKGPHGPVQVWDTESWVANSDERIAAYDATCYAAGLSRVVGTQSDQVALSERSVDMVGSGGGKETRRVPHSWSAVAALGASNRFMGSRKFERILYPKGLPWVYVFDGLPRPGGAPNPEDGTVVVAGDLGPIYGDSKALFWKVRSRTEVEHKVRLARELAALPASATPDQRKVLTDALAAFEPISGATMTLSAPDGSFSLYDYYGNRIPTRDGKIVVPLDARGFYLRGDGRPGSFAKLIWALKAARIEGYQPLDYACHDMTAPIDRHSSLRLTLSNILNRPIRGALQVTVGDLAVEYPKTLSFAPYETKDVFVKVTGGTERTDNCYPLSMRFDAGPDGLVVHDETMHVNFIAERTITVDGKLDDWNGIVPQPISVDEAARPTQMEADWKPWETFDSAVKVGNALGYLACDDRYLYFAAKIADTTPDDGTVRFETRDDASYFYPDTWNGTDVNGKTGPFAWPAGVRHYTYRKGPDLPGTGGDNVQIAFNVLPASAKPWAAAPAGTMPGFIDTWDTDYEYALDQVAPRYGGGTEIWRLSYPSMPHKHFYPRDPKSPLDGPVRGGKLVMTRDATTRYVECAIPWSEIPQVKAARDAGRPIKFSYRVTDNASDVCMELSKGRSVAKQNGITFHPDWKEHWANELEFGFEKPSK